MKPVLENIKLGKSKSILAFEYENDHFDTPWHFHPQYELTYIDESEGTKFIGDYVGPFQPGELVLLRSNVPHCWKNIQQENGMARSTVIQWNDKIFASIPELESVFQMFGKASRGLLFCDKASNMFIRDMKAITRVQGEDCYLLLLSLLIKLSNYEFSTLSRASFTKQISSAFESRISSVHDFVHKNYHRKIYLRELAEVTKMSETSFSRFFSKLMGKSFFVFLNEYRINMAARMLIDTQLSIAEIGYACGYESLPFFYKQFNKYKEISPTTYRRSYV